MAPSVRSLLVLLLFTLSMADMATATPCTDACYITEPSFDPNTPSPENQACAQACKECETSSDDNSFQPTFGNDGTFISYTCIPALGSDPDSVFSFVFGVDPAPDSDSVSDSASRASPSVFFRLFLLFVFLFFYIGCCLCVRRRLTDNVLRVYGFPPGGTYYGMAPLLPDNPRSFENDGRRVTLSSWFSQKDKVMVSEVPLGDSVMPLMVSQENGIHSSLV